MHDALVQYTGFCVPDLIHSLRKDKADSRTATLVLRALVASPARSLHPTHTTSTWRHGGHAGVYQDNVTSRQHDRLQRTGNYVR